MPGVKGPDGRIYHITITATHSTDDLDLAAGTADADPFIDERYAFDFEGAPPASDGAIIVDVDNPVVTLTGTVSSASEPPGEVPVIVVDNPADDETRDGDHDYSSVTGRITSIATDPVDTLSPDDFAAVSDMSIQIGDEKFVYVFVGTPPGADATVDGSELVYTWTVTKPSTPAAGQPITFTATVTGDGGIYMDIDAASDLVGLADGTDPLGGHSGGVNAGFCDGSVCFLSDALAPSDFIVM